MRRALVVVLLLAACTKPGDRVGAGLELGLCDAVAELGEVVEPAPGDPTAQSAWAEATARILARIDPATRDLEEAQTAADPAAGAPSSGDGASGGGRSLDEDPAGLAALDAATEAVGAFADALEAGDPAALQQLADGAWPGAADALTDLARRRCA